MTKTIQSLQRLGVRWAKEIYTVSQETRTFADSRRRRCWICGGDFQAGDGMTVVGTKDGNKLMHSRCYNDDEETLMPNILSYWYNYVTDEYETRRAPTTDDEATALIPQHPSAQALFTIYRGQGDTILDTIVKVLRDCLGLKD